MVLLVVSLEVIFCTGHVAPFGEPMTISETQFLICGENRTGKNFYPFCVDRSDKNEIKTSHTNEQQVEPPT